MDPSWRLAEQEASSEAWSGHFPLPAGCTFRWLSWSLQTVHIWALQANDLIPLSVFSPHNRPALPRCWQEPSPSAAGGKEGLAQHTLTACYPKPSRLGGHFRAPILIQTHSPPLSTTPPRVLTSTHWAHPPGAVYHFVTPCCSTTPSSPYPPCKEAGEVTAAKVCNTEQPGGHRGSVDSPPAWANGQHLGPGWGPAPGPSPCLGPPPCPWPEPAASLLGKVLRQHCRKSWCAQVGCFC